MGMGAGNDPRDRSVLNEINVTPLVDVMLVLLIIFMVAAGVQTVELTTEQEEQLIDALEEIEELKDQLAALEVAKEHQKVGVDLPKVDSEAVNLSEVKKLKLEVSSQLVFSIHGTRILDCLALSPSMRSFLGPGRSNDSAAEQAAFEPCLKGLGDKLVDNAKLQEDKELYVLADRSLPYGQVLRVMAAVRQAGVTKFGLVAEPDILGGATTTKTPPPVP